MSSLCCSSAAACARRLGSPAHKDSVTSCPCIRSELGQHSADMHALPCVPHLKVSLYKCECKVPCRCLSQPAWKWELVRLSARGAAEQGTPFSRQPRIIHLQVHSVNMKEAMTARCYLTWYVKREVDWSTNTGQGLTCMSRMTSALNLAPRATGCSPTCRRRAPCKWRLRHLFSANPVLGCSVSPQY